MPGMKKRGRSTAVKLALEDISRGVAPTTAARSRGVSVNTLYVLPEYKELKRKLVPIQIADVI